MVYCSNCGTEVSDAKFCPECGAEIGQSTEANGAGETADVDEPLTASKETEPVTEEEGVNYRRVAASVLMALLVGSLVAMAFSNIGGSALLFFVTLAGVTYYLYDRKSSGRSAIGSGLYIVALWLPITPIMFYLPMMGSAEEGTAEGAGQMIGSVLGMVIWGFVFFLIGLVVFAIGYFVNRGVDEE